MGKKKINPKNYSWLMIFFFLVALVLIIVLSQRFFFVPKILMIFLVLFVVALLGKLRLFLQDWFVFIGFIYLFDSLRGSIYIATCKFSLPVYATYVIKLEKLLCGGIPPVDLQKWLLHPHSPTGFSWFEKFITVAHGSHFVAFLLVGFIIWLYHSNHFRFFKISFYLVIFLGLLGYFAVPTVPPWMAANVFGLFPRIVRFIAVIYNMAIPDISSGFDTNPIAAMPSLHAAFPVLCSLILWRIYRWKAWAFYLYALLMLFVIVYTGEHYIVDVLAGAILAILCYFAAHKITRMKSRVEEKEGISGIEYKNALGKMAKTVIGGIIILFIGVAIGSYNRNQFLNHPVAYNLYMPKYVDFIKHEEEFLSSYQVQLYLGSHSLFRGEFQKAIPYYERALSLSKNEQERERAEAGLSKCKELLERKS